jgi:hypothetical protein
MSENKSANVKHGWIESSITTFLLAFVGVCTYSLAGDCTHTHSAEAGIGAACTALMVHRIVLLACRYG